MQYTLHCSTLLYSILCCTVLYCMLYTAARVSSPHMGYLNCTLHCMLHAAARVSSPHMGYLKASFEGHELAALP